MIDRNPSCANDATAPQLLCLHRFSWSAFCKRGIVQAYAPILAHADQNQWVRGNWNLHPGNTSRRLQWRNSLWSQRSWCPSSRQPAPKKPPNLCNTLSPSRPRSMSSRRRPKVNTVDHRAGQGAGPAPAFPSRIAILGRAAVRAWPYTLLWPRQRAFVRLSMPRAWRHVACVVPGEGASAQDPVPCCYRREPCPNSPSLPSSVRPLLLRPVPARRQNQSRSWWSPSWLNPSPPRATNSRLIPAQALAADRVRPGRAPSRRGWAC